MCIRDSLCKNDNTLILDDSCKDNQGICPDGGSNIKPTWLQNRSWARLGTSWRSLGASRRCLGVSWRPLGALGASWAPLGPLLYAPRKTWLSWNGKRVLSESCKHCRRLATKTQRINKAFASSFAGALRAPAQRLGGVSLGTPLARAGSTHRLKQSKMERKWLENAPPGAPKSLQNRSKVAPRELPGPPGERKRKW